MGIAQRHLTYHDAPSNEPPHVLHLLGYVSIFGILHLPAWEEQDDVTDDGDESQGVQGHPDEFGALSRAHAVTSCLGGLRGPEVVPWLFHTKVD